jgi:uncharacterized membrane protein YfcA
MEILGYAAAILIGISLGLIGGGGSSLALPVLVYLFHVKAQVAVSDSFFIVGITSLIGALSYLFNRQVCYRSALIFGIPSVLSVFVTHTFLLKAIPEHLSLGGRIGFSKDTFVLFLFSSLMVMAAFSMIRARPDQTAVSAKPVSHFILKLVLGGLGVGFLAGLVGAGGGFLIIPALVLMARLPMKKAIGTSLLIICVNSMIGLLSHLSGPLLLDWPFLFVFSSLSVGGIFAGMYISRFVPGSKLKPAFGWFILCIGTFIITQQLIALHAY